MCSIRSFPNTQKLFLLILILALLDVGVRNSLEQLVWVGVLICSSKKTCKQSALPWLNTKLQPFMCVCVLYKGWPNAHFIYTHLYKGWPNANFIYTHLYTGWPNVHFIYTCCMVYGVYTTSLAGWSIISHRSRLHITLSHQSPQSSPTDHSYMLLFHIPRLNHLLQITPTHYSFASLASITSSRSLLHITLSHYSPQSSPSDHSYTLLVCITHLNHLLQINPTHYSFTALASIISFRSLLHITLSHHSPQ